MAQRARLDRDHHGGGEPTASSSDSSPSIRRTFDIDQIVVAPEAWGSGVAPALIAEAKRLSPNGLDLHVNKDNARAIRFYEKHGFTISGEAINWRSGAPVHKMSWRP